MGSAFASLQQLVGIPIIAQQYAAAAFSALPPSTRPSLSPIPPAAGRSSLSPTTTQIHGSPPTRHHPQYQRQRPNPAPPTQQKSSPPPLSLLSTVGGHPPPSPEGGSLNGEYLEPGMRADHHAQVSPLMRKERFLDQGMPEVLQAGMRPSPNPTPPKASPISPVGRLTPHPENERDQQQQQQHPYSAFYTSDKHQQHHLGPPPGEMNSRSQDPGGRSGSESEGDQRVRHRRKQDQPRRQTVIYSNPSPGYPGPQMGANSAGGASSNNPCHASSSVSAEESSSDDSQGYETLHRTPNANQASVDPMLKENSTPSGSAVPLAGDSTPQLPISQAMSHALSHPLLAAHLNASSHNAFMERNSKGDHAQMPSHYGRSEYDLGSPPTDGKNHGGGEHCFEGGVGLQPHLKAPHNNVQYPPPPPHHHHHLYKGAGSGSSYSGKSLSKESDGPYYRVEREQPPVPGKEDYNALLGGAGQQHPSRPLSSPKGTTHYEQGGNSDLMASSDAKKEASSKMGPFHHHLHHIPGDAVEMQSAISAPSSTPSCTSAKSHYTTTTSAESASDHSGSVLPNFSLVPPSSTPSYVGSGDRTQQVHDNSQFQYGAECQVSGDKYADCKGSSSLCVSRDIAHRRLHEEDNRLDSVAPLSTSELSKSVDTICTSNGTNASTQPRVANSSPISSSNVITPSEQCCFESNKSISDSLELSSDAMLDKVLDTSSAEVSSLANKGSTPPGDNTIANQSADNPSSESTSNEDAGGKSDETSKLKFDNSKTPECKDATSPDKSEALVNGTSSPPPKKDRSKQVPPPKSQNEDGNKDKSKDSSTNELMNGNLEHIMSPCKNKKRRTECEIVEDTSGDVSETKRRTRQKRPVSYVEDETDPVLEMNEDMCPLLSPVKKRGRKCKEKSEVEPHSSIGQAANISITKDLHLQVYGSSNCLPTELHPRHTMSSGESCGEAGGSPLNSLQNRLLVSGKVPPNMAEPLHIDTSGAFKSNFRSSGSLNPVTPTLHSPDVYDFHDGEGDPSVRGAKGKRGRKRGSPKKQGRTTPEYLRSSMSPKFREGSCSRSPRSPKFFARSPTEGLTGDRLRPSAGPLGGLEEDPVSAEGNRISNGAILTNPLPQESSFCRYPLAAGPSQSPSDIFSKTLDMGPPTSHGGGSSMVSAPHSNSKIVDEVEKQLAALHKEHLPDTSSSPLGIDPLMGYPTNNIPQGKKAPADPKAEHGPETKPVHKPMLSVVPLEQLTYEGLRNKGGLASRDPYKCNELDRITKSPSGIFTTEISYPLIPTPGPPLDEDDQSSPESVQQQDPLALPSPLEDPGSSLSSIPKLSSSPVSPAGEKLALDAIEPASLPKFAAEVYARRGHRGRRPYRSGRGRGKEHLVENELDSFKGMPGGDSLREKDPGSLDRHLMDWVATGIPVTEQSVHIVSVSDLAGSTLPPGGRKRGGGRGRTGTGASGSPLSAPSDPERGPGSYNSNFNSGIVSSCIGTSTTTMTSSVAAAAGTKAHQDSTPLASTTTTTATSTDTTSSTTTTTATTTHKNDGSLEGHTGAEGQQESNSAEEATQPRRRRRSRRGANPRIEADGSPTASPPQLTAFARPPSREDAAGAPSGGVFDNRRPPSHREAMEDPAPPAAPAPPGGAEFEEGETLEDIAKFLEATAPAAGGPAEDASSPPRGTNSSSLEEGLSSSTLSSANASMASASTDTPPGGGGALTPSAYREGRPKRVSRPPPQMNDGEMNDLLLLLNIEDEESEDEDYIPKEAEEEEDEEESDRGQEDGRESGGDRGTAGGDSGSPSPSPSPSPPARKKAAAKKGGGALGKKVRDHRGARALPRRRGPEEGERRGDRRGPIVRLVPGGEEPEMILNAPGREDEEQEKGRKGAPPFALDSSSIQEGSWGFRGSTRVGFNSTLHNNYDAFNKDLDWFCAFCKNYSHFATLGDLFGPFYVKNLTVVKKSYPEVVDGQVAADRVLSPPPPCSAVGEPAPGKQKNKRTPKPESSCGDNQALLEAKRVRGFLMCWLVG